MGSGLLNGVVTTPWVLRFFALSVFAVPQRPALAQAALFRRGCRYSQPTVTAWETIEASWATICMTWAPLMTRAMYLENLAKKDMIFPIVSIALILHSPMECN